MIRFPQRTPWWVPCLAAALIAGGSVAAADEPLSARAFEVRYRNLSDAADLISPLLSDEGSLTLRPRLKRLVIQDTEAVLDRVAALLSDFDLPPKNVEITLSLFLGRDQREESGGTETAHGVFSKEVRGVIETLGDFTKWTAYEPLGSRSVTGVEGGRVEAHLSEEYRVIFTVNAVHESQGTVKFDSFALQRLSRDSQGREAVDELYKTGMVLNVGRLHVVGAASGADSKRALFLTVQVEPN